jgi:uncharacterized protein involved in tolerance to divalent cations
MFTCDCIILFHLFLVEKQVTSCTNIFESNTSTSRISNDHTIEETVAEHHTFPKRDRTTSLMALQLLAEKIAQCNYYDENRCKSLTSQCTIK